MEKNNWKVIPGFEQRYAISRAGEVLEIATKRRLNIRPKPDGYYWLTLRENGKYKNFYIHRLVAQTFIPEVPGKTQVNHKNGIKSDNRVENLEWVSPGENSRHRYYILGNKPLNKPQKAVRCIELKRDFESVGVAGRSMGISSNCIAKVARGNTPNKTAGGYHWKYIKKL